MKLLILLILFVFASGFLQSQPVIQWQKSFGGSNNDDAYCIKQTRDGGYIVAGSASSNDGDVNGNQGSGDYWIVKLNTNENIVWAKTYGGSNLDVATSVQQTADGGYIVAGYTLSNDGDVKNNHGNYDCWVIKLNSEGDTIWTKIYGGSSLDQAFDIRQTSDGGYIMAATSFSHDGDVTGNHGYDDYWIVKLDNAGTIMWQRCYGGTDFEECFSIQPTSDGGYITAGQTFSNDGDVHGQHSKNFLSDVWLVKLNSIGDTLWTRAYGGTSSDGGSYVQQTTDGGYIVAASSYSSDGDLSFNKGADDYWIFKTNTQGSIEWSKSLGGSDYDAAACVQQTKDEGFIVAGYSHSLNDDVKGNHGNDDYWIIKLSNKGDTLWTKCLGGSNFDRAISVIQSLDNGYVVAGLSSSEDGDVTGNHGNDDYWIVKLSSSILPLTIINFDAQNQGKYVFLQWQTTNELDVKNFVVERSDNGKDFLPIAEVIAKGKNSFTNNYSITDELPLKKPSFYHLKMVDKDGSFTFSKIIQVNTAITNSLKVFPNPVSAVLNVQFSTISSDYIILKILNTSGKIVQQQFFKSNGFDLFTSINIEKLSAGIYFLTIEQNGNIKKVFFEKK